MTIFDDVSANAQKQFPGLQVKYKNESALMKTLGTIMFFNPAFMSEYVTTIGSTIYFPSRDYVSKSPDSATITLLHELVHVYDSSKENNALFSFLYLIPQIFVLLFFPLLFISWKFALLALIFLFPLPAYFRMLDERRAYTISLYVVSKFMQKGFKINIDDEKQLFVDQFKNSAYYFMWPFKSIDVYFENVLTQCKAGSRPNEVESAVYDMIDKVLAG